MPRGFGEIPLRRSRGAFAYRAGRLAYRPSPGQPGQPAMRLRAAGIRAASCRSVSRRRRMGQHHPALGGRQPAPHPVRLRLRQRVLAALQQHRAARADLLRPLLAREPGRRRLLGRSEEQAHLVPPAGRAGVPGIVVALRLGNRRALQHPGGGDGRSGAGLDRMQHGRTPDEALGHGEARSPVRLRAPLFTPEAGLRPPPVRSRTRSDVREELPCRTAIHAHCTQSTTACTRRNTECPGGSCSRPGTRSGPAQVSGPQRAPSRCRAACAPTP